MPYSNYPEIGKEELLVEHILKDALFLLNSRYNPSPLSDAINQEKPTVKSIVIACNTATAYGKKEIEYLLKHTGINIKVIGVIDAGSKGALECFEKEESGAIAIFATPGTVKSGAYVHTIEKIMEESQYEGDIRILQHGGKGLAESIDNKSGFINTSAEAVYENYLGPSLVDNLYKIDRNLLDVYQFDTTGNQLLYNNTYLRQSDSIQINSVDNYVRYHMVSLTEKLRNSGAEAPLRSVVLGCTHYPYVKDEIEEVLGRLRSIPAYRHLLANTVTLVDPSQNTASELYAYLANTDMLNTPDRERLDDSMFFISIPNRNNTAVSLKETGSFTYEYQYNHRNINELTDYTLIVPFSNQVLSDLQLDQIKRNIPETFKLLIKQL